MFTLRSAESRGRLRPNTLIERGGIHRRAALTALVLAVLLLCGHAPGQPTPRKPQRPSARSTPAPRASPAVTALLQAFDRVEIVALGEAHGLQEEHELLGRLIQHPRFARKVRTIVVEFGSARHQGVLNDYLAGARVRKDRLQQVWRDTSQPLVWDAPVYEQFFATVRSGNRGLPANRRLQVLLGDPSLDWSQLHTRADYDRARTVGRSEYMRSLLQRHALAGRGKALWIAGTAHVRRRPGQHVGIEALERRSPGSTWVVLPHLGLADSSPAAHRRFERLFATWRRPSLAPVKRTTLGALPWREGKLEDELDAYLYLGPVETLTMSHPSPAIYRDETYFRELDRRYRILNGHPLDRGRLLRPRPRRFEDN